MFLPSMLLELWTYMYFANEISVTSIKLQIGFQESEWLNLSTKNKKALVIAQEGMIRPLRISCYRLFDLNLQLFTNVRTVTRFIPLRSCRYFIPFATIVFLNSFQIVQYSYKIYTVVSRNTYSTM